MSQGKGNVANSNPVASQLILYKFIVGKGYIFKDMLSFEALALEYVTIGL